MVFRLCCFWACALGSTSACGPARDTKRAQNRLDLAKDLLSKHQLGDAENEVKKALAADPADEEAENVLGLVYFMRANDAISLVETQDCLDGDAATELRTDADQAMRTAEKHFKRASELATDYGEAFANRGAVALYFHDWDKAIELEDLALEHTERMLPTSGPLARANEGWAYFEKGDYPHALEQLLQANNQPGYFCLGKSHLAQVQFARGDFDKALETLQPMLTTDEKKRVCPALQDVWYLTGESYLRLHKDADAKTAFDTCVDINPKSCQAKQCDSARRAL